ncbi:hypothetical protein Syun_016466 [Stephania yunnanensis]|uniref:Uncharacterized protein n=1 Tax=Stephania yunnanensis TaxID=152371 RepID=A0AAP0J591_9MAGN
MTTNLTCQQILSCFSSIYVKYSRACSPCPSCTLARLCEQALIPLSSRKVY